MPLALREAEPTDLWISEDGLRIFTRCGNVFRASDVRAQDMTYNGSLTGLSRIEHLDDSATVARVAAIPEADPFGTGLEDTEVLSYEYATLGFLQQRALPTVTVAGTAHPTRGRFVFYNANGSRLFVVVQADPASGLLADFGVVVF